MKTLALLLLLAGAVSQEPDVYPPGHVCVRAVDVKGPTDHACSCQRKCVPSEDSDGNQTVTIQEDNTCLQWCHKEHCSCPVKDCP